MQHGCFGSETVGASTKYLLLHLLMVQQNFSGQLTINQLLVQLVTTLLWLRNEPCRYADIAQHTGLAKSVVTRAARKLHALGMVHEQHGLLEPSDAFKTKRAEFLKAYFVERAR